MSARKKIAAIITEYRVSAHADVIVGKFIKGFPTDEGLIAPRVDIASMYLDQIPENDIGLALAEKYGIPVYRSIRQALCLGGDELAVDDAQRTRVTVLVEADGEILLIAIQEKLQWM